MPTLALLCPQEAESSAEIETYLWSARSVGFCRTSRDRIRVRATRHVLSDPFSPPPRLFAPAALGPGEISSRTRTAPMRSMQNGGEAADKNAIRSAKSAIRCHTQSDDHGSVPIRKIPLGFLSACHDTQFGRAN